jgi:aspartyl-tRNA(Asn)/glutamyl-tRNA(Gln) amidotransferase subunit B
VDGGLRRVGIERLHLEEDVGKLTHEGGVFETAGASLVDFNRAGVPLMEIVSRPDLRSPAEAAEYLRSLRAILRYLGVCDGNMEEGSLRCDANISLRPAGAVTLGTKVEIKNMNSFRHVRDALEHEAGRQARALDRGERVTQETRLWNPDRAVTVPMRSKEQAHDYRYFPEPDLVPLRVAEPWREEIYAALPELPMARRNRFVERYGLPKYDADVLTDESAVADYFDAVAGLVKDAKLASNWVMGEVLRVLKEQKITITQFAIKPAAFAELLNLIADGTISAKVAKEVFEEMLTSNKSAKAMVAEKGLVQVSDTSVIEKAVEEIIAAHPQEVERFRNGEEKVFGFLVGQLMKATKGKANPKVANEVLRKRLQNR